MQAIWGSGKCSVEAVHRIVSRKRNLKETTTRTLMRRLEQKGYLKHESDWAGLYLSSGRTGA